MDAFDKIIGYQSIKKELAILADMMRNGDKYTKLGVTMPRGILLYGAPGVGKTLMANCLIEASGRKVYTIRKDIPDGDFVKAIQETFEQARKNAPSIVFLDDMDKFADENRRHSNAEEYVTVQSCIDDAVDSEVFVVATANDEDYLPDSLLREGRLGRKYEVNCPKGKDAIAIIQHFLSKKECVAEVNAEDVAKMLNGDSCARLEAVINEAGIFAASQNKDKIDMDDLMRAIQRIKFDAPESDDDADWEILRRTAYHEAGHTVVAEVLAEGTTAMVSILAHEGCTRGITDYYQDETYWEDMTNMENRVLGILGGKAATEVVFGKVDVGASRDLHRAFDIVERFVDNYCAISFDSFIRGDSGDEVKNRKDNRIAEEMNKYYAQAKHILIENRAFLDAIAEALLEKKILVASDILHIKEGLIKEI